MKFKEIQAICKKTKAIRLYENETNVLQWIGDGYAIYPLFKMPIFKEDTIFAAFDIPDEKKPDYLFKMEPLPEELSFADTVEGEEHIEIKMRLSILVGKIVLEPLYLDREIMFIDTAYLKPIADYSELEYYKRISAMGNRYIAVKSGLILVAVIIPQFISAELTEEMETVAAACKRVVEGRKRYD